MTEIVTFNTVRIDDLLIKYVQVDNAVERKKLFVAAFEERIGKTPRNIDMERLSFWMSGMRFAMKNELELE